MITVISKTSSRRCHHDDNAPFPADEFIFIMQTGSERHAIATMVERTRYEKNLSHSTDSFREKRTIFVKLHCIFVVSGDDRPRVDVERLHAIVFFFNLRANPK
jgi:hypothetical protein